MKPGIDPRVDYAFKRVFGAESNTPILADFLNAVIKPADWRIVDLVLRNPFNEKDDEFDKLSILDIKARDDRGRQYNVEMQMLGSLIELHRILYYWAVLHSDQLQEGDDYRELRATISILILNDVVFPRVPGCHQHFQLRSEAHPQLVFSPHLSIHALELPKFDKSADELTDPLDAWCYFLKHGEELDTNQLPAALQTPMVTRAMEVLTMLSQNELERERYRARLKWERDQVRFQHDAEDRIQAAHQEGILKGSLVGRIHLGQRLLKLPTVPEAELLARTVAELQAEAAALEKQLGIPEA